MKSKENKLEGMIYKFRGSGVDLQVKEKRKKKKERKLAFH